MVRASKVSTIAISRSDFPFSIKETNKILTPKGQDFVFKSVR